MSSALNDIRKDVEKDIKNSERSSKLPELFNKIVSHTFQDDQALGIWFNSTPGTIINLRTVKFEEVTEIEYLRSIKEAVTKASYKPKSYATSELYQIIITSTNMEWLIKAIENAKNISIDIEELKKTSNISDQSLAL